MAKEKINTAQKMKFSIKNFFCKCDQIRSFLKIWSHLLKKSLMNNFIFCAMCAISMAAKILLELWQECKLQYDSKKMRICDFFCQLRCFAQFGTVCTI